LRIYSEKGISEHILFIIIFIYYYIYYLLLYLRCKKLIYNTKFIKNIEILLKTDPKFWNFATIL